MEKPSEFIHILETKQEVALYLEEVVRLKPLLLVFTRIHKIPYVAMCWQKIRVVVFKKDLINRPLLFIINNTIRPDIIPSDSPFSFAAYAKSPASYIGEITLESYLIKSDLIEKHGINNEPF